MNKKILYIIGLFNFSNIISVWNEITSEDFHFFVNPHMRDMLIIPDVQYSYFQEDNKLKRIWNENSKVNVDIFTINKLNNIEKEYFHNEVLTSLMEIKYDNDKSLTKTTVLESKLNQVNIYVDSSRKKVAEYTYYNSKLLQAQEFSYNNDNLISEIKFIYNYNGVLIEKHVIKFDYNIATNDLLSKVVEIESYDNGGFLIKKAFQEYDNKLNLINLKTNFYRENNIVKQSNEWSKDCFTEVIYCDYVINTESSYYNEGRLQMQKFIYEFNHDEDDKEKYIEILEYDSNQRIKTKTKSHELSGNELSKTIINYTYDNNGNILRSLKLSFSDGLLKEKEKINCKYYDYFLVKKKQSKKIYDNSLLIGKYFENHEYEYSYPNIRAVKKITSSYYDGGLLVKKTIDDRGFQMNKLETHKYKDGVLEEKWIDEEFLKGDDLITKWISSVYNADEFLVFQSVQDFTLSGDLIIYLRYLAKKCNNNNKLVESGFEEAYYTYDAHGNMIENINLHYNQNLLVKKEIYNYVYNNDLLKFSNFIEEKYNNNNLIEKKYIDSTMEYNDKEDLIKKIIFIHNDELLLEKKIIINLQHYKNVLQEDIECYSDQEKSVEKYEHYVNIYDRHHNLIQKKSIKS